MKQERWQRLQVLFEQALASEPSQRAALLASIEPDPDLRAEVLALLGADASEDVVDHLVQRAAALANETTPDAGARVGPWRLLDELGAGGMGTVFRAERADGAYQRLVAIKFLRGIPTRDGAERMRRERQILADLDHPHIAGLLDGGSTAEGQPYLVMDYVEGQSITDYARGQDIQARLRLIQQVARAVQFAHQHLVIHRDLKPANVLVRADGTPALLDFGIAKLLDADAGEQDGRTQAWFTPGYASPEQRRGEAVSTASDIYALGQLLAEVVSGEYRAPDAHGEVVVPSARSDLALPRRRQRELDAVVQQACAVRASDRYRSAEALADDIERFFRHQPVHAAPARPLYLVGKFLRRHRFGVAAAAVFALAIAAFTWRLASERDRALRAESEAQQNSATAERVIDYLVSLFQAASPEQAGNRPIQPAELIDRGRARIDEQLTGQPRQHARLLGVLAQIDGELGRSEQAADSLRAAIAIEREHGTPAQLIDYLIRVGILENQVERPAAALAPLNEAVALLRSQPDNSADLARALMALGLAKLRLGHNDDATATAAEALRQAERSDERTGVLMAEALQVVAETDSRSGRHDQAVAAAERSLAIVRASPTPDDYAVATALGYLANVHVGQENYAPAEALFREMLELRLRTLDPGTTWATTARNNMAQTIYAQGRIVEALALMQENIDFMRARGDTQSPSFVIGLNNVASVHELTGNYPMAIQLFAEMMALVESYHPQTPEPRISQFRQNYGRSLMLAGRLQEAWPHLEAAIVETGDSAAVEVERGRRFLHLADWLRRSDRLDEVAPRLIQAETVFRALFPDGHPRLAAVTRIRGLHALAQGRNADAERLLRAALASQEKALGPDSNASIQTRVELVEALARLNRRAEARRLLTASAEPAARVFVADAPIQAELRRLQRLLNRAAAEPDG